MEKTLDYIFEELKKIKKESRISYIKQSVVNCICVTSISFIATYLFIHKLKSTEEIKTVEE